MHNIKSKFLAGVLWLLMVCLATFEMKEKGYIGRSPIARPGILWEETERIEVSLAIEHTETSFNLDHTHTEQSDAEPGGVAGMSVPPPPPTFPRKSPPEERPQVSFIVPYYNEGNVASRSLINMLKFGADSGIEIIAVDDFSTDDTAIELRAVNDSRIQILNHSSNLGYSPSVVEGILKTTGKYVVVLDAEVARVIVNILPLIHPLQISEAVATYLVGDPPQYGVRRIRWRYQIRRVILSLLSQLLWGEKYIDEFLTSGAAYKGSFIRQITKQSVSGHYLVNTLNSLIRHRLPIKKVPIQSVI